MIINKTSSPEFMTAFKRPDELSRALLVLDHLYHDCLSKANDAHFNIGHMSYDLKQIKDLLGRIRSTFDTFTFEEKDRHDAEVFKSILDRMKQDFFVAYRDSLVPQSSKAEICQLLQRYARHIALLAGKEPKAFVHEGSFMSKEKCIELNFTSLFSRVA